MRTFRKAFLAIAAFATTCTLLVIALAPSAAQAQSAQNIQNLHRLYVGLFGLPPDFDGYSFYLNQLGQGASITSVATLMGSSPAYNTTYSGLSLAQIIDKHYLNMFAPNANPPAISHWSVQMNSGSVSAGGVVIAIANSAPAGSADESTLGCKVSASTAFFNALDTSPKILAYSSSAAYAIGRAYLTSVTDCASAAAAMAPANIQSVINQVLLTNAVTLQSAKSRKSHGSLPGFFDINVRTTGPISIEPRNGRNGHLVIFQFSGAISNAGTAQVTPIGNATPVKNGNAVEVTLTGIPDNQRVTISLAGVNGNVSASLSMGFLVGDVNDSGIVSAADIAAVKANSGRGVDTNRARFDLTTSGTIDSVSASAAKTRSGWRLP